MTLPTLPSNLNPSMPSVPQLTPNIPQFPKLPTIPTVPTASINLGQFDAILSANPLIQAALPESFIDELLQQAKQSDGSIDFNEVTTKLNAKVNQFTSASSVPSINPPELELVSIVENLIPTIPVIKFPSPADIKQYVNGLIEKKKIQAQEAITQTQLLAAELETKPFSSRIRENNNTLKTNLNVGTFTNGL